MKVCVALPNSAVLYLEVDELGKIEDIKVLIEVETGVPVSSQTLMHQGRVLEDSIAILDSGLLENDIIQLHTDQTPIRREAISLLQQANTQPGFISRLELQNPHLAQVLKTGNIDSIEEAILVTLQNKRVQEIQKLQREAELEADPLDASAQMEIEKVIKQKNIDENLEYAEEYTPEVFGSVEMLYIDCKVNNIPVQAFVDSGAQNTIMSKKCAERLNIMRLVDTRFKGQALGVGVDTIVGRIHAINLEIGGKFFNCCFHVLENAKINILFGLDMLKRHQCCIDLHKNVLTLNAGEIQIPFLSEASIKKYSEEFEDFEEEKIDDSHKKKAEIKPADPVPVKITPPIKTEPKATPQPTQPRPQPLPRQISSKVQKLTALGFSTKEAEEALLICQGNEEQAAAFLFEKSNMF
jgi:DNA damage-inducible protein 1